MCGQGVEDPQVSHGLPCESANRQGRGGTPVCRRKREGVEEDSHYTMGLK